MICLWKRFDGDMFDIAFLMSLFTLPNIVLGMYYVNDSKNVGLREGLFLQSIMVFLLDGFLIYCIYHMKI